MSAAAPPTAAPTTSSGSSPKHSVPPPDPNPAASSLSYPPVCLPCAHIAVRECPRLRGGFTAVRVRALEQAGVCGASYQPGTPHPVPADAVSVTFGSPALGWVRAGKLLLRLRLRRLPARRPRP
jgi:hypothetical protein